jgi:hypothetical protein
MAQMQEHKQTFLLNLYWMFEFELPSPNF